MIDDNHAIVSSTHGPEYYVNILSFVDKDELQPSSTVLLHNKTNSVVGILGDNVDPMVSVMKVEKAPLESYSDIGGLETQIQEIKEVRRKSLYITHPSYVKFWSFHKLYHERTLSKCLEQKFQRIFVLSRFVDNFFYEYGSLNVHPHISQKNTHRLSSFHSHIQSCTLRSVFVLRKV